MNTESNIEYYVQDETLNPHIDNIISYKKFLENLLDEIKVNNYNKNMVKLLSRHIEKSLSEISNDTTLFDYTKKDEDNFTPSVRVVSVDSDTSDSDTESDVSDYDTDDAVGALSDDEESQKKKLQFYKTKMELYSPHVTFAKPSTMNQYYETYNDEPEFLDETPGSTGTVYNPYNKCYVNGYGTNPSDYSHSQNIHHSPNHVTSHGYFLRSNSNSSLNKDPLDEKLDYYSSIYSNSTKQELLNDTIESTDATNLLNTTNGDSSNKLEDQKQPFSTQKPKDKLANEFLNNNLELNNYHYLKSFNLDRINHYCNSVNTY